MQRLCRNTVDFLDVNFNLNQEAYYPFRKAKSEPLYIHKQSNHPQLILKQIPTMIRKRISMLLSNENHFKNAKDSYELIML